MILSSGKKKNGFCVEYLLVGMAILWLSCVVVNTIQDDEHDGCNCNVCAPSPHIPTTRAVMAYPSVRPMMTAGCSMRTNVGMSSVEQPMIAMRSTGMSMPVRSVSSAMVNSGSEVAQSGNGIAMRSTSAHRAMAYNAVSAMPHVHSISTSASAVSGGVTLAESARYGAPARITPPPTPDMSDWIDNGDGTMTCIYCGVTIDEDDYYDVSHLHGNGICGTLTPIVDDIATVLFMAMMAMLYVLRKRKWQMSLSLNRSSQDK